MSEKIEHTMLCTYIKKNYPEVIFLSDASGLRMTLGQAIQWKKLRSSNGIPDIIILCPRNGYHGLCIEMKRTGEKIRKKDLTFTSAHLEEQNKVLTTLCSLGYVATFALGFEEAKNLIDDYMNGTIIF